jgi:hypothetical protein
LREKARGPYRGQYAPRLWEVWAAGLLVLAVGVAAAAAVLVSVRAVATASVGVPELIRTTLAVMAFFGARLTGLYAYRKQRLAEGDATRADAQQFADRYTKAAEQLGAEQAAVRLAGVYAMARLADDWTE